MAKFPSYIQTDTMTCGPTCLRMIAEHYGKKMSLATIVNLVETTREGTTLLGISQTAEKIGFRSLGIKASLSHLMESVSLPSIAHWNQGHFVVIYKIRKNIFYIADPLYGLLTYTKEEFVRHWIGSKLQQGILLQLEITPTFYVKEAVTEDSRKKSLKLLIVYLLRYKRLITQLFIGLMAGSILQLIVPLLTQSLIDVGINNRDINFIYLILFAQLMLFIGRSSIDIMRNYIFLHMSSRINISLVSDFVAKLMRLPISYFDTKMTGDIMQRINDNKRIESFFTNSSLSTLFSLFNFFVFSVIVAIYSLSIFYVFLVGSALYFSWILFFLKRRADLDFKKFKQNSQAQSKIIELINGMTEIKLHNAERQMRWQWEDIQIKSFKLNLKGLSLSTTQNTGSSVINELKNIIIIFLSAKQVLDGQITLGMMLSISYIVGQLNAPVFEIVNFVQRWQDAKLSLDRLGEIYDRDDEEPTIKSKSSKIEQNSSIVLRNVSFKYIGVGNPFVLENLNFSIPAKRITAIVGVSGSGKTTLMKLLLKFYDPTSGNINLNETALNDIFATTWRDQCGVVMQEGFIFNDTIAKNIAVGVDEINDFKLQHAANMANISEFIETLPLKFNTKIGMEGLGISTGQKQRILIARAVYKDPEYIFFDEATSSLDANNEKMIMKHLTHFFKKKTVVVIAHRLSTVKNADQIIVLDKGKVIEIGNHNQLVKHRGAYFELVKNQLELGN